MSIFLPIPPSGLVGPEASGGSAGRDGAAPLDEAWQRALTAAERGPTPVADGTPSASRDTAKRAGDPDDVAATPARGAADDAATTEPTRTDPDAEVGAGDAPGEVDNGFIAADEPGGGVAASGTNAAGTTAVAATTTHAADGTIDDGSRTTHRTAGGVAGAVTPSEPDAARAVPVASGGPEAGTATTHAGATNPVAPNDAGRSGAPATHGVPSAGGSRPGIGPGTAAATTTSSQPAAAPAAVADTTAAGPATSATAASGDPRAANLPAATLDGGGIPDSSRPDGTFSRVEPSTATSRRSGDAAAERFASAPRERATTAVASASDGGPDRARARIWDALPRDLHAARVRGTGSEHGSNADRAGGIEPPAPDRTEVAGRLPLRPIARLSTETPQPASVAAATSSAARTPNGAASAVQPPNAAASAVQPPNAVASAVQPPNAAASGDGTPPPPPAAGPASGEGGSPGPSLGNSLTNAAVPAGSAPAQTAANGASAVPATPAAPETPAASTTAVASDTIPTEPMPVTSKAPDTSVTPTATATPGSPSPATPDIPAIPAAPPSASPAAPAVGATPAAAATPTGPTAPAAPAAPDAEPLPTAESGVPATVAERDPAAGGTTDGGGERPQSDPGPAQRGAHKLDPAATPARPPGPPVATGTEGLDPATGRAARAESPLRYDALAHTILARARTVPRNGAIQMRFALEPADLGTVRVRMESQGERLRVEIAAASGKAVEALHAGVARLTAQLQDVGFKNPEVTLTLDADDGRGQSGAGETAQHGERHAASERARRAAEERRLAERFQPSSAPGDGRLDLVA